MNNLAKTIILPHGCVENFVDFSDLPNGGPWAGEGIFMSATAHHVCGYRINHPHPRRHTILYCENGSYEFEYKSEKGTLNAGEILILPSGSRQFFRTCGTADGVFFLVDPAFRADVPFLHKRSQNTELVVLLMKKLLREQYSERGGEGIRGNLANLILALVRQDISALPSRKPPLERLTTKLRLHPEHPWTIREMAEVCRLSPSHLFAVCRNQCGCSPYGLLTTIRMELAKTLLIQTDYPVKIIASQSGYRLPFSFTRTFAKHEGMSPLTYRRTGRSR